ncbi:MAG TPA: hypothetical protein VH352_11810 [Pseudonocardiaceae bacterium]|jgi:hypothetical protein|nr:hypothetical protein [Pseudonocardiaceae bacterium]
MNANTIKNIARIAVTTAIAGVLALGLQTAFTTASATTAAAHTVVVGTSSNPWEG